MLAFTVSLLLVDGGLGSGPTRCLNRNLQRPRCYANPKPQDRKPQTPNIRLLQWKPKSDAARLEAIAKTSHGPATRGARDPSGCRLLSSRLFSGRAEGEGVGEKGPKRETVAAYVSFI